MADRDLRIIQSELADMARIKSQLDSHYAIDLVMEIDKYNSVTGRLAIEIGGGEYTADCKNRSTMRFMAQTVARLHAIDQDTADSIHEAVNKRVKELEDELVIRAKDLAKSGGI